MSFDFSDSIPEFEIEFKDFGSPLFTSKNQFVLKIFSNVFGHNQVLSINARAPVAQKIADELVFDPLIFLIRIFWKIPI